MEIQTNMPDPNDITALLASLTAAEAAETSVSDAEVEEILAAKEIEDAADASEELDDAMLASLEASVARAEVYETQQPTSNMTQPAAPAAAVSAPKAPRAAKTSSGVARTPRKALTDLDEGVFQRSINDVVDAASKAATIALRPTQVKVAEKFDNLFLAIANGKLPSNYVVVAFKTLNKFGAMTSADLVAAYKATGLKDGTARSQAGQIMELFNVVGIALRSGQALSQRADSTVAVRLNDLIGKTAA